jgi:glycosyltransferase involved in cell wall biosynthesis
MPTVVVLSVHPAPYRDATFDSLYRRRQIDFSVSHYFSVDHGHTEWDWSTPNYPHLFSRCGKRKVWLSRLIHLDIIWRTAKQKYDILVVPGYSRLTSLFAILVARVRRKPVILVLDTIERHAGSGLFESFKRFLKQRVRQMCQAYWVPGFASTRYLLGEGVDSGLIAHGAYCLDAANLGRIIGQLKESRIGLRKDLRIDEGARVVLAVGKMTSFRRYDALISSWAKLKLMNPVTLLFVGGGPMFEQLILLVKSLCLSNVKFAGPCSVAELPKYYALSDAYVHPGVEPFSTALELAAIAGLPILANKHVGYVHELLERDAQPLLFDVESNDDLSNKLTILLSSEYQSTNPGEALAIVAAARTSDWAAREFESLVFKVCSYTAKY